MPLATVDRDSQRAFDTLVDLRKKMTRPQRHRLLHGYPLASAMPRSEGTDLAEADALIYRTDRGLLVGVLPHPFCNPAVTGCGFCTFPHEAFSRRKASAVVERVVGEIEARVGSTLGLSGRAVSGLYFGGGTANLTPPESFRALCRALARSFDLSGAEVTLEGVPGGFLDREPLLVDILRDEIPARHFRLSMGIQTFDPDRLRAMGRVGFGNRETFREVVRLGHDRGFTVSGDLLFNLPGQSGAEMVNDLERAVEIGLDHVGLYHLVLFEGLGTEWSRDPALVASLPTNKLAAGNWVMLREMIRERGFDQTTLTNFERREFAGTPRRFVYEESSFRPDRFDMVGFGPSGISYAQGEVSAVKTLNPDASTAYTEAVDRRGPAWDRAFRYGPGDLRVFHLTRRLSALEVDRAEYRRSFGTDPVADFPVEFDAMERERLVLVEEATIRPTATGMFYADSMAGLLAGRRPLASSFLGRQGAGFVPDSNARGHM